MFFASFSLQDQSKVCFEIPPYLHGIGWSIHKRGTGYQPNSSQNGEPSSLSALISGIIPHTHNFKFELETWNCELGQGFELAPNPILSAVVSVEHSENMSERTHVPWCWRYEPYFSNETKDIL